MYFDTVACETVRPSFSSPWIRDAPLRGSRSSSAQSDRTSALITGPTRSAPTLPRPVASKSLPMPPDHRLRPHYVQRMPPVRPDPGEEDPEQSVHLCQPRPRLAGLPHGELLRKRKVLERQFAVRAKTASQRPKDDSEPSGHRLPDRGSVRKIQIILRRTSFWKGQLTDPQRLRRSASRTSGAIRGYVGGVDRAHEFVGIDWLGEVTLKTSGQRATALVGTRMRRERDGADGYSVRATLQLSQSHHEVVTVEHRHADIGQYDLYVLLFKNVQSFRGRGGQPHLCARRLQHRADERPRLGIVVDEHHAYANEQLLGAGRH